MTQTFIIHINPEMKLQQDEIRAWDFFRVGCKKINTCRKYLQNWYKQAFNYGSLYRKTFLAEGATYSIVDNTGKTVESGLLEDII